MVNKKEAVGNIGTSLGVYLKMLEKKSLGSLHL